MEWLWIVFKARNIERYNNTIGTYLHKELYSNKKLFINIFKLYSEYNPDYNIFAEDEIDYELIKHLTGIDGFLNSRTMNEDGGGRYIDVVKR